MLLTVVKLRGSSSNSKAQMFLFSFPCFGWFFFRCEKEEYSFGSDRNQICVSVLSLKYKKIYLLCIDFCFFLKKDFVLWGIPLYFDYSEVEAKSYKTYSETNIRMLIEWMTHSIVWCTAELKSDLLRAWELMPTSSKYVH